MCFAYERHVYVSVIYTGFSVLYMYYIHSSTMGNVNCTCTRMCEKCISIIIVYVTGKLRCVCIYGI